MQKSLLYAIVLATGLTGALACSAESPANPAPAPDAGSTTDSEPAPDARELAPAADASRNLGTCASSFGNALTASFGRLDGTLAAIVIPNDQSCAMPNRDHLVVQVTMNGAVYRMVVNVQSDRGSDRHVRLAKLPHALPQPPFAEGWHAGVELDYAALGAHSTAGFATYPLEELVDAVVGELTVNETISVYATSGSGRPESTHLVHRNDGKADGAIVLHPQGADPTFLLFHFSDQTF